MSALTPLAHILNKAQGVIDAETGLPIDVGGEVVAIRDELRNQRDEITRLQLALDDEIARASKAAVASKAEIERCDQQIKRLYEIIKEGVDQQNEYIDEIKRLKAKNARLCRLTEREQAES